MKQHCDDFVHFYLAIKTKLFYSISDLNLKQKQHLELVSLNPFDNCSFQ